MEAHPDDRAATALVATIDELFVIDAQAQKQNLTVIERANPGIDQEPIETAKGQTLLKSALALQSLGEIPIREYLTAIFCLV